MMKVLSIDGGGVRGIIPARILQEIEIRTNKHISQLFNIVSGTSTGGLLTLALTKPDTQGNPEFFAGYLVEFYKEFGFTLLIYGKRPVMLRKK